VGAGWLGTDVGSSDAVPVGVWAGVDGALAVCLDDEQPATTVAINVSTVMADLYGDMPGDRRMCGMLPPNFTVRGRRLLRVTSAHDHAR